MKNIIIFLVFFYCNVSIFLAQVTVTGGTSMVVQNEVLSVQGNINLVSELDNIQLRDEAQLIQRETGTTNNTGLGYISLFQEGNASPFHFNYWASPVGNQTNTTTNNSFQLAMLRDGDALSVNFGGQAAFTSSFEGTWSPLTLSSRWFYTFDGLQWSPINQNTNISPANGFLFKGTNNAGTNNGVGASIQGQRYNFQGKPNSGTINVPTVVNQHYLIGNPYPSALDADQFILDNSDIINGNTLYFWDQWGASSHISKDYTGNYATYVSTGLGLGIGVAATTPLIGVTNNTAVKVPKRYIPVAQGFFIEAADTGSLVFNNSQRPTDISQTVSFHDTYKESATEEGSVFLKSSVRSQKKQEKSYYLGEKIAFPTLVFNIEVGELFNRHLLLVLRPDANETAEIGRDAQIFSNLASDAFWPIASKKYNIQSDAYHIDKKFPLAFQTDHDAVFKIKIEANENNAPEEVYLYDKVMQKNYSLKSQQTLFLSKGSFLDRFEIHFQEKTLTLLEAAHNNFNIYYDTNYNELVVIGDGSASLDELIVYDITAKPIFKSANLTPKEKYIFPLKQMKKGVYIVKLKTSKGFVATKKVIVI